jgi:ABC-2 type transport system permease protein
VGRIWQQCLKELLQFLRDPLTARMTFTLPLVTLLIYGFAIRLETKHVRVAIQDFDRSPLSRAFAEQLRATNQLDLRPLDASDPAGSILKSGAVNASVVIPPGFERRLKSGKPAEIQALVDGSDVTTARVIRGGLRATTGFFNAVHDLGGSAGLQAATRTWFNPGREEALFIVPGTIAFVLSVFPAMIAAINMGREKEQGTIVQAYASSITATEFLLGKCAAFVLIGIADAVFLIAVAAPIWHLRFAGDPTPLIVGTPVFMAAVMMLGIMLGAMGSDQLAAIQAVGTIQPLVALLLSGFLYPLNNIPAPASYIAFFVPVRYYIELMRDAFVRGTGWGDIWYAIPCLALLAIAEFFIAWLLLRRMQLR